MKSGRKGFPKLFHACAMAFVIANCLSIGVASNESGRPLSDRTTDAIPWSQVGAKAGADYQGDGLAVIPARDGARLRCVFQRLEAEATPEGLWLGSTLTNAASDRFRVVAAEVSRLALPFNSQPSPLNNSLPRSGSVSVDGKTVRFTRPGLIEEYTVSMDGVRQDFVITQRPSGDGELQLLLDVTGARVEATTYGAQLVLENSGRKIAYSRLRVTDANGRELPARIEVSSDTSKLKRCEDRFSTITVVVNDSGATYPVRVDPTFSDSNWIGVNPSVPGADTFVYAAVVDGSGNLILGGNFTVVGNINARYVARWNGSGWSALGAGMNGWVHTLAVSGDDVYAGGAFTTAGGVPANRIAKWNGSSWSALGKGLDFSSAWALAVTGNVVYVGGQFAYAGGTSLGGDGIRVNNIAKWDGTNWSALGLGMNNQVNALALSVTNLFAGGSFTTAGGIAANRIAKWDGNNWSQVGEGMNGEVRSLGLSGQDLYAGGAFTTATNSGGGTVTVNHIAKWDGASFFSLGSGMGGSAPYVDALAASGGDLYAAGWFTSAGGVAAVGMAKWNGIAWSSLGSGLGGANSAASAIAISGDDVYVGGGFNMAGGVPANFCAKWDGNAWWTLGTSGMNGVVRALVALGSDVYAGGDFTTAGSSNANYIAKWNGNTWSALGLGMNSPVWALGVHDGKLFAGGAFTTAGGTQALRIATWDGSSWSVPGPGMSGLVYAFTSSGNELYAGGAFDFAYYPTAVNRIAKWNGTNWSALGLGVNGAVFALALSGSNLYVGGNFTVATNGNGTPVTVNRIARWNGVSWSALGSGMNERVSALAVLGTNLFAGGYFTTAGGQPASRIAKWNGSNWSALGQGMYNVVAALTVNGSDLYAGGYFITGIDDDSDLARYIARWDGTNWTKLGSGMNNTVLAMTMTDGDLYAGGGFSKAGGNISAYVARAILNEGRILSLQPNVPAPNTATLTFAGIPTNSYPVQFATNLTTSSWFTFATNTANTNGRGIVLDSAATNDQRYYRVVTP